MTHWAILINSNYYVTDAPLQITLALAYQLNQDAAKLHIWEVCGGVTFVFRTYQKSPKTLTAFQDHTSVPQRLIRCY